MAVVYMLEVHNLNWQPHITYASGLWGCGAIWNQKWLQVQWDDLWRDHHIAVKKLLPIMMACAIWGHQWRNQQVLVKCNNMAVVQVITNLTSRDPMLMHLL